MLVGWVAGWRGIRKMTVGDAATRFIDLCKTTPLSK